MLKELAIAHDEEARYRIVSELDTTFLVEAGAGSGKTTSIVGRMIALIKARKTEARHIAAITFTNKAASELLTRFRIKLEQEIARAENPSGREALEAALRQVPECFIGTIHSFCGKLLRERPIEAGLDPAFREMEEQEDEELQARSWDEYVQELQARDEAAVLEELAALQIDIEDLRAVYNRVCEYEDVAIFTEHIERPDFDRIRVTLFPMVEEAELYIPTVEPEKEWDALQKAIRAARRHMETKDMNDDRNVLLLAKLFDRGLLPTLKRWTDAKKAKYFKEQFQEWQAAVLKPFLQQWREYVHPKVIAFVLPAVRYAREKRMEAGKLNFQDLLMKAAELLRSHPAVRQYFAGRYRKLFVDEFQDTDPIQAEMMMLLTGADSSESDWRKQLPRPGSLFVVGDPKQSVYRFRRADISTYNFVKERITTAGEVLQLTRNFRSVQAIGDYVNYAFESKFAQPGILVSDCQAAFVPMLTQQSNPLGKRAWHGVYTLTVPKQERDRQADISLYDAERTAQFISWACAGNLKIQERSRNGGLTQRQAVPGDFLILLHFRRYISLYAQLLESYGLSSDTSGSQGVLQELEALHLLAQALNDPSDQVALLAVLRGILFGISDDDLYHYRQEGGNIRLYPSVESDLLTAKGNRVEQALCKLRQYAEWTRLLPAAAAFTRITDDMGIVPVAAAATAGAIRSGTLIKLLEVLQSETEAAVYWRTLTERLGKLTEKDGMEAASLFAGSGTAVRIMNLHKAKGLEAPVVLLACPCGNVDHDASEYVDRMSEPPQGYFTITKPKDTYTTEIIAQPTGWLERAETERLYMHAEKERLLYVAATRAKQLLVVSQYPDRPAIDPWSPLSDSLQHQLELDVPQVAPVTAEELSFAPDVLGALDERVRGVAAAAQPTYQLDSVTRLAKSDSEMSLQRSAEGKGMAYGTLVHRLLQALGEGMDREDLKIYCRIAAEEEGVEEKWLEQADQTAWLVTESPVWARSVRAKRCYHEFSFMTARAVSGKDSASTITALLRGVIDLVFEEEDGWVIVDYKTDHYELGQEQCLVEFYKAQVLAYMDEWERSVGGKVKEAGLYFLHSNRYVTI
ncbi:UvrD-helicase domain-containing protein [Paenibacillus sp. N4]|uniref:UvrD-helicase domain-containing protein n=1 Tax=Paenibacillus vietnamensis TaxID=2590547 RepID=UPI001CD0F74C|nr:UvrD-helicase domain-containing protein [Paenibacillus vietnamensis]MCA0757029.1 UvrD-helicase domain-containing protein [Paenibacillus vietnamensis]